MSCERSRFSIRYRLQLWQIWLNDFTKAVAKTIDIFDWRHSLKVFLLYADHGGYCTYFLLHWRIVLLLVPRMSDTL